MNEQAISAIASLVGVLTQANIAIPVVVSTAMLIKGLWNSGQPDPNQQLSDAQLIDAMDAAFKANGAAADAEIARLRATLTA